jgi:hypothetical protein
MTKDITESIEIIIKQKTYGGKHLKTPRTTKSHIFTLNGASQIRVTRECAINNNKN